MIKLVDVPIDFGFWICNQLRNRALEVGYRGKVLVISL